MVWYRSENPPSTPFYSRLVEQLHICCIHNDDIPARK